MSDGLICVDCEDKPKTAECRRCAGEVVSSLRWIPVSERLPKESGSHWVFDGHEVTLDNYIMLYNDGYWYDEYHQKKKHRDYDKVTHWSSKYMPDPPDTKPGKEEK